MKTITISWSTVDVLAKAEEMDVSLTEEQADEVLDMVERKHDASIGINWDVIEYWINEIKHEEE